MLLAWAGNASSVPRAARRAPYAPSTYMRNSLRAHRPGARTPTPLCRLASPPVGPAAQLSTAAVYGQVRVDGVAVPGSGVSLNISGDSTTHTVSVTGEGGGAPAQTYAVRLAVAKVPPLAKLSVR